jgi:hypothetical protein
MECLYVILEMGCSIKRLSVMANKITVIFSINEFVFTVSSLGIDADSFESVSGKIREQLKLLHIDSIDDWRMYAARFYSIAAHTKNIAIMKFILNAMISGWRVRKSVTRPGEYRFSKNHNGRRKYLSNAFLSRFLEHNAV